MESKLPKPSGLKRPLPVINKTILPSDRIKSSFTASKCSGHTTLPPLTRDLTNTHLQTGSTKEKVRAISPDIFRAATTTVTKHLRRSRSACDLRDMRPLKRPEPTLAPIPAKVARIANNSSLRPARFVGTASSSNTNNKRTVSAVASTSRAALARPVSVKADSKKPTSATSNQTSVSTTGAGKPINKRIPPYDFKARYNDLLEKHKVLKEKYDRKTEEVGSLESMPEQLEETQAQLYSTKEQLRNALTEIECLQRQVKSQALKLESITSNLLKTSEELEKLKAEHSKVSTEHAQLSTEVVELRESKTILSESNQQLLEDIAVGKEQLFQANMERALLHNTVMDLKGNIRVFCRVRPPLESEQDKLLCDWNYIDEATVEIQCPDLIAKNKGSSHTFNFDHVFHSASRQEDIFEMVSPLIQSALDGYNICIFAYGQTGSGKTFTMDGIPSNVGVIPRTVDLLFDSIKNYARLGWTYEIKLTCLEIYNEVLYDLLSNEQKDMEIRMSKNNKNDIYVSNIQEEKVCTAERLRHLMEVAKMNRATAATMGNERSSRSHAVTKIQLIGTHAEKQEISIGTINLVDLAGSESPKTSIRMTETKNINRSLSELTNVILALLQKQDHIPYRNSKLTHLLMPALGGNSKTLMFINVAPFQECFVESVKSLRFAASVNSCKMAKAKRNRFLNNSCSNGGSLDKF